MRPNSPISERCEPLEWEYADDSEFNDESREALDDLHSIVKDVLEQWDLFVNEDKTDFEHFFIAKKHDKDEKGESLLYNEPWRTKNLFGSKLCSIKDIQHRISLGWAAFTMYSKVWLHGPKISFPLKLQLYDALVISVMLYNSSSWAVPHVATDKFDATHRKHLKTILNVHWP